MARIIWDACNDEMDVEVTLILRDDGKYYLDMDHDCMRTNSQLVLKPSDLLRLKASLEDEQERGLVT